jgi:hypothetical protein
MKGFFFVWGDEFLTFCEKYFLNSQKGMSKKRKKKGRRN